MKTSIYLLLTILATAAIANAQPTKDKIEVGGQTTSLTIVQPDFFGDSTQQGFGGRFTYNFNRSIAADAEINFFPQKPLILSASGSAIQGQFGIKVGKRFDKFGIFAKVRPGFLSVGKVFSLLPGTGTNFKIDRNTMFSLDSGGVLELYPSQRLIVRFDAGDTAIRHPPRYDFAATNPPSVQLTRSAKFKHNFQITAGVAFRLGDFPSESRSLDSNPKSDDTQPRYEVGAQYTSLVVEPPTTACQGCVSIDDDRVHVEPGLGGRFTFNLTQHLGIEAEGNFYTRENISFVDPSGHMFQGQFGVKAGKRFEKWGLFAKGRPGFIGFTKVNELVATHSGMFGTIAFVFGEFRQRTKLYPSFDVGGVIEFYIARRWMARFDVGDTIIRYGELPITAFSLTQQINNRPPETRHNLQITTGLGFRF